MNSISFKFFENFWILLENAVFIELYKKFWEDIFFLKNWSETDFVINSKEKKCYQVCYDLNEENKNREIKWCIDWMKKFGLNQCFLITFEQEDEILIDDKKNYSFAFL